MKEPLTEVNHSGNDMPPEDIVTECGNTYNISVNCYKSGKTRKASYRDLICDISCSSDLNYDKERSYFSRL